MAKLTLGTVQFGLSYGISNAAGQIALPEAKSILKVAEQRGVDTLDTAPAYGQSEQVLGQLQAASGFELITKTPQFKRGEVSREDAEQVRLSIATSLEKLGTDQLYGLLVHWPGDLLVRGADLLWKALSAAKEDGLVKSIGVSIYEPQELIDILDRYPIDIVQAPMNVLDQRMLRSGAIEVAKKRSVEVHIRSVFLQGLLLMRPHSIPAKREIAKPHIEKFCRAVENAGLTPLQVSLAFVAKQPDVQSVVCGVTSAAELEEIADALAVADSVDIDFEKLSCENTAVIDPRVW